MNTGKSKNAHFIKEIFPNGFSLSDFENEFKRNKNIIKDDRNIVKILQLGGVETVVKSFKTPNFLQAIIYKFFRKSKARRSYEYSFLLNQKGIKTPEPLGYIEVFDNLRLRQSYYISRKLEFDFALDSVISKRVKEFEIILKLFIKFTYSIHKKNIMHLDYVVGNICIKKVDKGYEFFLVDLNRLYNGAISTKKGVQNLARLSNDPEILEILAYEYAKRGSISFSESKKYLMKSLKRHERKSKLKKIIKSFFGYFNEIDSSAYSWDYYSNQPYTIENRSLKHKIFLLAWYSNLKIFLATIFSLFVIPFIYFRQKVSFEKKIENFGLCVNIQNPLESQKSLSDDELIAMIEELSVKNILVRLPLADIDNFEKYFGFIKKLKNKNILLNILQDRNHINDKELTRERLDFIFNKFHGIVNEFQIGNSINRKKWAFLSVDEYFSFFKVAYDLKVNKFSSIKLLGGNIIDFDIPFFSRSIFHFKSIYYDGIATQLYVDRRGGPEQRQFGFDTLAKINTYSTLARASIKTSNELNITEVNWPLKEMGQWAPAKEYLIEESLQSSYLVRYYLLMLASGKVKVCYWHQLVAPGYGLVNNLNGRIIKRQAFYSFKFLISIIDGGVTKKLLREKNIFCFIVEKDETFIEAVWSIDKNESFKSSPGQLIYDIRGNVIDTENSPIINLSEEVIYFEKQKNDYKEINLKAL